MAQPVPHYKIAGQIFTGKLSFGKTFLGDDPIMGRLFMRSAIFRYQNYLMSVPWWIFHRKRHFDVQPAGGEASQLSDVGGLGD